MRISYNSLTTHATCVRAYARGLRQLNATYLCTKKAGLLAMSFHRLETCGNACNATTAAQASNKLNPISVSVHKISRQSRVATTCAELKLIKFSTALR